jgi:long-chain acyl-CoA synthetase
LDDGGRGIVAGKTGRSVRVSIIEGATQSKLTEYLNRAAKLDAEFLIYDDGYRGRTYRYRQVAAMANAVRERLRGAGIRKGDVALIWSESRPGWVAALWACLLEGVVVAPVDPQSSAALCRRIENQSLARVILIGERVAAPESTAPVWRIAEIESQERAAPLETPALDENDIAEIVFTSGTTAEPKGVVITHRNLLANLEPVAGEIAKYQKYAKPFLPLRLLNLLPLSHLFGQSLAMFLPPLVPASVVFISGTSAQEIARQVKSRKISAIVAVPKMLELLRDLVAIRFPEVHSPRLDRGKWPMRWWRFRRVHRYFGWKFWALISGGAPLPPEIENFWRKLGYVVVQGYGLTETAPIVTLSHPFHVRGGTVGKPLRGVDVKIAEDGEVLVRGANVTAGYFRSPEATAAAFEDGWFHTGDIGELDAEGHLRIRGRKKEQIVTPEGLKVFPEDVEKVLNAEPGVRESAVIGTDRVHAVLALEESADAEKIVREVNAKLEDHQKIRAVSIWPHGELPRTQSTGKLRRGEIARAIATGAAAAEDGDEITKLLQKYAPGRKITRETTLDELGLSSLDRVQLMMELEQKLSTEIDERAFSAASRVADLAHPAPVAPHPEMKFPRYSRSAAARAARRLALPYFLLPLMRIWAHLRVSGRENLAELKGPVIFASNHQSHFDVPAILASLPPRLRYRLATAMSKEFFDAHFFPERHSRREYLTNSLNYWLATFVFNAFPLPQRQAGAGEAIRYMGELVEQGWSILIFPEGDRTSTGEILPFQPGVGMIAAHLGIPVAPVRIVGLDKVLHRSAKWPSFGRVEVKFGRPMRLEGEDFAGMAREVERAVRVL